MILENGHCLLRASLFDVVMLSNVVMLSDVVMLSGEGNCGENGVAPIVERDSKIVLKRAVIERFVVSFGLISVIRACYFPFLYSLIYKNIMLSKHRYALSRNNINSQP